MLGFQCHNRMSRSEGNVAVHAQKAISTTEHSTVYLVGVAGSSAMDMDDEDDFNSDVEENEDACAMKVCLLRKFVKRLRHHAKSLLIRMHRYHRHQVRGSSTFLARPTKGWRPKGLTAIR